MEERRRFLRHAIEGELATVPAVLNVRVLDISLAGVLLQSSRPVDPGSRGRLSLNLEGHPFRVEVEVQRVAAAADASVGYRVGATFVTLSRDLRHVIERFMTQ